MKISSKAIDIANSLYDAYGSSKGNLFGVHAMKRKTVEVVIQFTLDVINKK